MRFLIQVCSHAEVSVDAETVDETGPNGLSGASSSTPPEVSFSSGTVSPEAEITGRIGRGYAVLIGIEDSDTEELADRMVQKLLHLRINPDENGKTNRSLSDVGGSLLLISQFTLYADAHHGNRPNFLRAGSPDHAEKLYDYIVTRCRKSVPDVQCGVFGAHMHLTLTNEGPFTILLDSDEIFPQKS